MRKVLTAAVLIGVVVAVLASFASARTAAVRQRVSISNPGNSFVLRPTSAGPIKSDKGALDACCWTTRHVVLAGERLDVNDPHLTLTGRNGTLKLRNRIVWVDVPGGLSIFTGTWRVVGGTGAYAGLSGRGRVEGVQTIGGNDNARFFGFFRAS
jgi:hypothetical protein